MRKLIDYKNVVEDGKLNVTMNISDLKNLLEDWCDLVAIQSDPLRTSGFNFSDWFNDHWNMFLCMSVNQKRKVYQYEKGIRTGSKNEIEALSGVLKLKELGKDE